MLILQRRELRLLCVQPAYRLQQLLHLGRGGDVRLCVPCDRVRRRGTDRQGSSCSDASCDVCPSNTCTDSSSICILDVAGRASLGASRPSTASWTHTRSAHLAATRAATSARPTHAPTAAARTFWTCRGRVSLRALRPSTATRTLTRSAYLAATRAATPMRPTRAPTAAAPTSWTSRARASLRARRLSTVSWTLTYCAHLAAPRAVASVRSTRRPRWPHLGRDGRVRPCVPGDSVWRCGHSPAVLTWQPRAATSARPTRAPTAPTASS